MDLQQQLGMDQCLSHRREQLYRQLLTNASRDLTFSQDVMWERGPHSIPYSKGDFPWLFCASGPLAPITRSMNPKRGGKKSLPHHTGLRCYVTRPLSVLPPLQTVPRQSLTTDHKSFITVTDRQDGALDSVKRIGLCGALNICSIIPYQLPTILEEEEQGRTNNGVESVLKKLTKNTAQWIVNQQIPRDYQNKARLQSLLDDQYVSASTTDLGTDESMGKEDFCSTCSVPKSSTGPKPQQSNKPETLLPVYYRMQGYSVSPVCIDEQGGINRTANEVTINHSETPKLPCLQDYLNPHAGKYVYHTENHFELELYTGIAKQVHRPGWKNQDRIIMDNNSEYRKNLQVKFPCSPEQWTDFPSAELLSVTEAEMSRPDKGVRRWVGLPTKADYATELGLRPPDYNRQDTKLPKQPINYSPMPSLSSLRYAVEGWKNAWKIKTSWHSVTIEGLKKDLTDLQCQVRIAAIATCASAAVNRPEVDPDPDETAKYGQSYEVEAVPPELQPLLLFALNDPVKRVQLAAAVCQCAVGKPNAHALNILQNALEHDSSGTGADGWVAAQCLAIQGEASQTVIQRLLSQLFISSAPSDQEQAATILASISSKTILVPSLLGEHLNCTDWRNRVLACKTISVLKCPINKDLTNKLLDLMWNDWSAVVRQAAAQALGKLGLGTDIHNELCVKLHDGPTSWRVEALVLIGQLKIMTAKLLPSFLKCLNDEFVVRKQACSAAASLMIKDKMIQNQLFQLMQKDPSCDVKVAAINALGRIGWLTPALQELLLWALQHEKEPSVRIAACEALKVLGVNGPELQNLLQERFTLEVNAQVHRHLEDLMQHCGYSLDGDKGRGHMITEQVQKLCTKSNITEKLLQLDELKQQTQSKMLRKESWPEPTVLSALVQGRFRESNSSMKN